MENLPLADLILAGYGLLNAIGLVKATNKNFKRASAIGKILRVLLPLSNFGRKK